MDSVQITPPLHDLLRTIHSFHRINDLTILFDDERSISHRIRVVFMRLCAVLQLILSFLASFSYFSNNNSICRLLNFTVFFGLNLLALLEFIVYYRRKKVLKLVEWCNWVETYQPTYLNKPEGWFNGYREKTRLMIK